VSCSCCVLMMSVAARRPALMFWHSLSLFSKNFTLPQTTAGKKKSVKVSILHDKHECECMYMLIIDLSVSTVYLLLILSYNCITFLVCLDYRRRCTLITKRAVFFLFLLPSYFNLPPKFALVLPH